MTWIIDYVTPQENLEILRVSIASINLETHNQTSKKYLSESMHKLLELPVLEFSFFFFYGDQRTEGVK